MTRSLIWLFRRWRKADEITDITAWRIGVSCAASWSWGVSLAVGVAIMRSKGLLPFGAWMAGNVLALPLFSVVLKRLPASRNWIRFVPMLILFGFVEYFAITLNLEAIRSALSGGMDFATYAFMTRGTATFAVAVIGLLIVGGIHKWGLRGSVLSDQLEFTLQVLAVAVLAILCVTLGERTRLPVITTEGREWIQTGFLGIITGALGTGHQWQRFSSIKEENVVRAGLWGGFFFGIYMIFVAIIGLYLNANLSLSLLFLLLVFVLSTSTIDSAVAGLQFLTVRVGRNPLVGTLIAGASVVLWLLIEPKGLTSIWTFMARIRYPMVLSAIFFTIMYYVITSHYTKHVLQRAWIMLPDGKVDAGDVRRSNDGDIGSATQPIKSPAAVATPPLGINSSNEY